MDALCAYSPRCACHVSCLSSACASTSKYSSPGHRVVQVKQTSSVPRLPRLCSSQPTWKSQRDTAANGTASSQRPRPESLQLTTTQPANKCNTQRHNLSSSQRLARSTAHGFAAAALLTFLLPDPSYSAESLPIEFLRSWVVSALLHACCLKRPAKQKFKQASNYTYNTG